MKYEKVTKLGLMPTGEERLLFEIAWQSERIKNLELIVHELLRNRINKELADGWLEATNSPGFTPTIDQIDGRGKQIAALLDIWPASEFDSSVWPEKPDPKQKS